MTILFFLVFLFILMLFCFFMSFLIFFVYFLIKGYRIKKNISKYKERSVFRRLYYDFPRQFWLDVFSRDPEELTESGLHLFCGEQGSGKTISVVHLLLRMRQKYPSMKIRTNFDYFDEDDKLSTWQELVKNHNGIYGQVEVIDEIQTWFSSLQSKDFPPEMLNEVSQQRKQRKMIVGTAQIFGRVSKPIREQTSFVYCPKTFLGCLTFVRVTKPIYYDEENFVFKKYIRTYFFVHNPEIREAFDTYKKIDGMVKAGFNVRMDLK